MDFSSLTFSSTGKTLEEVLQMLMDLREADCHAFPYEDIGHIAKTVTSRKRVVRRAIAKGFVPDLDYYLFTIAGCCSWGRKAIEWDFEKRLLFSRLMTQEFFGEHPEYLPVRRWITDTSTPELFRDFVLHEEMRVNVLALIRLLDQLEGR